MLLTISSRVTGGHAIWPTPSLNSAITRWNWGRARHNGDAQTQGCGTNGLRSHAGVSRQQRTTCVAHLRATIQPHVAVLQLVGGTSGLPSPAVKAPVHRGGTHGAKGCCCKCFRPPPAQPRASLPWHPACAWLRVPPNTHTHAPQPRRPQAHLELLRGHLVQLLLADCEALLRDAVLALQQRHNGPWSSLGQGDVKGAGTWCLWHTSAQQGRHKRGVQPRSSHALQLARQLLQALHLALRRGLPELLVAAEGGLAPRAQTAQTARAALAGRARNTSGPQLKQ
jgi:hypothetical protein